MDALQCWNRALAAWDLPEDILTAAPEWPWALPVGALRRRAEQVLDGGSLPGTRRAGQALPPGGMVLDVGAGPGTASLPLASRAARILAVDRSEEMLAAFQDLAGQVGAAVRAIPGGWPEIAGEVPVADVVLATHVLYNVPDLAPFLTALADHARRRVVLELPARYPHAWMADLWEAFHDLDRPTGPSADDLQAALRQLDLPAHREDHPHRDFHLFADRPQAVSVVRRRLCLSPHRDPEILKLLGSRLAHQGDLWALGPYSHTTVVLWWEP